jgi:hypothetical protein
MRSILIPPQTAVKPPRETWLYRFIEGVGTNVRMDFVDTKGNGEFQMTRDPAARN